MELLPNGLDRFGKRVFWCFRRPQRHVGHLACPDEPRRLRAKKALGLVSDRWQLVNEILQATKAHAEAVRSGGTGFFSYASLLILSFLQFRQWFLLPFIILFRVNVVCCLARCPSPLDRGRPGARDT